MDENQNSDEVQAEESLRQEIEQVETPQDTTVPGIAEVPDSKPPKQKFRHKKLVILLIATVLLVGGASAGATYFLTKKSNSNNNEVAVNNDNATSSVDLGSKDVLEQAGTLAGSYAWLDTPKQIDKLPLFKASVDVDSYENDVINSIVYYQIGSGVDGSDVYVVAGQEDFGGRPYIIVTKKGDAYSIIKNNSSGFFYAEQVGGAKTYSGPELLAGVSVDPSSSIPDMKAPDEVVYRGQKFSTKYLNSDESPYLKFMDKIPAVSEYLNYQEVGKIAEGTVYESTSKDDPIYKVSHFEVRIKPALYLTLYLKGELSDQEIDPITWSDGSQNAVNYLSAGRGCGGANGNEIAKYGKDQLAQIGKSTKGQIIYGFKDSNNALLLKHHEEYIEDSKGAEVWMTGDDSEYKKGNFGLAINDYVKLRPLYLVEDGMGRFLVFSRQDLVITGGCAKPVIYAYPTSPTLIDVSVGADVTVSDPLYEASGWSNVFAMPNGMLGYNGKQYDSLFWEGFGHGTYPEITKGAVVEHTQAEATMRSHLSQLGLNDKESSDFMEFWITKIPNSPFVRLSWLQTSDMELLAPLYVSPAPDTRIRVFLDMEGLDEYRAMPTQKLTRTTRVGFTVVEWGGLVVDGSVPLLK